MFDIRLFNYDKILLQAVRGKTKRQEGASENFAYFDRIQLERYNDYEEGEGGRREIYEININIYVFVFIFGLCSSFPVEEKFKHK